MRQYGGTHLALTNNKKINSESCQHMKVRLSRLAFRIFQNTYFLTVVLLALTNLRPRSNGTAGL